MNIVGFLKRHSAGGVECSTQGNCYGALLLSLYSPEHWFCDHAHELNNVSKFGVDNTNAIACPQELFCFLVAIYCVAMNLGKLFMKLWL